MTCSAVLSVACGSVLCRSVELRRVGNVAVSGEADGYVALRYVDWYCVVVVRGVASRRERPFGLKPPSPRTRRGVSCCYVKYCSGLSRRSEESGFVS